MTIRVLRPGAFTTVQDLGRHGWQRDGVPVSGAMDDVALRLANWLVGNDANAAALEATLTGPSLRFEQDAMVAITGADMDARIDDRRVPPWRSAFMHAGEVLELHAARAGCRAYVAVAGGIDVPEVLGSRSTYVRAGLGGFQGRALARGDELPAHVLASHAPGSRAMARKHPQRGVDTHGLGLARDTVRFIPGPFAGALHDDAVFTIGRDSDRMGIRLQGPALDTGTHGEQLSAGVAFGTIQLPPGGAPIILMADRQTTGGYPRLGDVATVDLPVLAQARPGDTIRLAPISLADAENLYIEREREMERLRMFLAMEA